MNLALFIELKYYSFIKCN